MLNAFQGYRTYEDGRTKSGATPYKLYCDVDVPQLVEDGQSVVDVSVATWEDFVRLYDKRIRGDVPITQRVGRVLDSRSVSRRCRTKRATTTEPQANRQTTRRRFVQPQRDVGH